MNEKANRVCLAANIDEMGGMARELQAKISRIDAFFNGDQPQCASDVKAPDVPPGLTYSVAEINGRLLDAISHLEQIMADLGA